MKLDVGRSTSAVGVNVTPSLSGPIRDSGATLYESQIPKVEEAPNPQKNVNQVMCFSLVNLILSTCNLIYRFNACLLCSQCNPMVVPGSCVVAYYLD